MGGTEVDIFKMMWNNVVFVLKLLYRRMDELSNVGPFHAVVSRWIWKLKINLSSNWCEYIISSMHCYACIGKRYGGIMKIVCYFTLSVTKSSSGTCVYVNFSFPLYLVSYFDLSLLLLSCITFLACVFYFENIQGIIIFQQLIGCWIWKERKKKRIGKLLPRDEKTGNNLLCAVTLEI